MRLSAWWAVTRSYPTNKYRKVPKKEKKDAWAIKGLAVLWRVIRIVEVIEFKFISFVFNWNRLFVLSLVLTLQYCIDKLHCCNYLAWFRFMKICIQSNCQGVIVYYRGTDTHQRIKMRVKCHLCCGCYDFQHIEFWKRTSQLPPAPSESHAWNEPKWVLLKIIDWSLILIEKFITASALTFSWSGSSELTYVDLYPLNIKAQSSSVNGSA